VVIKLTGQAGGVAVPVRYDYRAIIEDMLAKIASGEWPPGFKLPKPRELAAVYSVSEGTVRRVIDILKDRGVLEGHQGVGVFVSERTIPNG
jgi:GntR family transcriptional regulator